MDMDILISGHALYVYAKLGPLLCTGIICGSNLNQWAETKIHVRHGSISPTTYTIPALI